GGGWEAGGWGFVSKPVQSAEVLEQMLDGLKRFGNRAPSLVVVEPDERRREQILAAVDAGNFRVAVQPNVAAAAALLKEGKGDCVLLGPNTTPAETAALADASPLGEVCRPSVILFEDGNLEEEGEPWKPLERSCVVRRGRSLDRLLDQAAFALHHNVANLSVVGRQRLEELHKGNKVLTGKKVLVVDDDIRNIFALSSILEEHEMVP